MKNIDWNEIWKEGREKASWRKRQGDQIAFWNTRARRYNDSIKKNDRATRVIPKLDIDSEDTVLDIGAGPGTLTIPLARIAKHVTVVEPSTEMLFYLKRNAEESGLSNICCINKRWEEVIAFKDLDKHDVLIASYSLSMPDMKAALSKMNELATKHVYLFTFAAGRMWDYDELWPKLYDEEFVRGPDYCCIYNILHDMGIYANVEITKIVQKESFSSLDDATRHWMENLGASSPKDEEIIKSYLSKTLVDDDGALCSENMMKSAMIWWKKEDTDPLGSIK